MGDMMLEHGKMPVSTPEEQGVSSAAIISFLDRCKREQLELHSLQIVRNGKLITSAIAKPFTEKSFHRIFSAAKGVVATGMLLAIQDGYYDLHELVVPRLPKEWIPEDLDEKWNRLTIYHLLTMNTGHDCDTLFQMWGKSDCWIKTFFEVRPAYEPGTYFRYDMGAQYVMNELVRLATGKDLGRYLKPRIFDPLGIEYTNNYTEPEGHFFSSTIQFHPDALTKLSQLYLQKGSWEGKQLIREDLAVAAGQHHVPCNHYRDTGSGQPDSTSGYGFHLWRNSVGGFRFSGGQGQFGIVLPDQNMAVGILATENDNRKILQAFFGEVFTHLYKLPMRPDPENQKKLQDMCENFNLAPQKGDAVGNIASLVNGKTYVFTENPVGQKSISFDFRQDYVEIQSEDEKGMVTHVCGYDGNWIHNKGSRYLLHAGDPDSIADLDRIFYYDTHDVMLSGSWQSADSFAFTLRSDSLLCGYPYVCRFLKDRIEISVPAYTFQPRNKTGKGDVVTLTGMLQK